MDRNQTAAPSPADRDFLAGLTDEQLRDRIRNYSGAAVITDPVKAAEAQWELDRRAAEEASAAPSAGEVTDVDGRAFGPGARVEVVSGSALSTVSAAAALLGDMVGWRGRVLAVESTARGGLARVDFAFADHPRGLVMWADRVRVVDEAGESGAGFVGTVDDGRCPQCRHEAEHLLDAGCVARPGGKRCGCKRAAGPAASVPAAGAVGETREQSAAGLAALRALVDEHGITAETLRAVADEVQARNAAGRLVVHEGRGENEHGVPRRSLTGSLEWERYDGGEWRLQGYGSTSAIGGDDVDGAQAWAAALLALEEYDRPGLVVLGWEQHRDAYGDWWEPVTR
ncbi:hypothetical protein [Micromonospora sp. RP3T]|uniref:hypothetical protein n=1 Tax=Micromonospora sp. RP3T TaxID=2135446 RepID=UPI003D74218C